MAETDKDILFGSVYKHDHGNAPIISGSGKLDYNILVKNNLRSANRAMHGSIVTMKHQIGKNRTLFQVLNVEYKQKEFYGIL